MALKELLHRALTPKSAPIDPDIQRHVEEKYYPLKDELLSVTPVGAMTHVTAKIEGITKGITVIKQPDGTITEISFDLID